MTCFLHRCSKDRSAGVALIFAVTVIPVIGVIGLAIDFGLVTQAKTQLNLATDAAAMAAAKGAADAFTAGKSVENARAAGRTAGMEWFKSQAGTVLGMTLQNADVTVPPPNGGVFTSQAAYQGTVRPYFAPIFGISTIALSGSSSATITANAYVSVTFLLDNSSSMLVAATQDGVNKMGALTPVPDKSHSGGNTYGPDSPGAVPDGLGIYKCAFACHWKDDNKDYYGLALGNNILLRFDVLQDVVASAIKQMEDQKKIPNQFSVAIYTFNNALTKIYPTNLNLTDSADLDGGATAAKGMRSPVVPDQANTYFPAIMDTLANGSKVAGDGSTSGNSKRALIIVTDGLVDYGSRTTPTSKGPINPADCAAMKNRGYNVYVLYTTFVTTPLDTVLLFNHDILPYLTGFDDRGNPVNVAEKAMVPSLQACASTPANFAQASDPDAIKAAMKKLLQAALSSGGRYTQ